MLEKILIGILCLVIGALVSYFVTNISNSKVFKETVKEAIHIHNKIKHKDTPSELIALHEKKCLANKDYQTIISALQFLVIKMDGNPKELGL